MIKEQSTPLLVATTSDGKRIEIHPANAKPYTVRVDTSRDYKGNRHFERICGFYKTLRGAKHAAALVTGEKLTWAAPAALNTAE